MGTRVSIVALLVDLSTLRETGNIGNLDTMMQTSYRFLQYDDKSITVCAVLGCPKGS